MKKRTFLALGVLGTTSAAFSFIGKERGLYGRIEIGLKREGWRYSNSYNLKVDRDQVLTNFQIGYNGYILRPRFIHFDIRGDFRIDRSTYTSNNSKVRSSLKGYGYNLNLRLFRGTSFPIYIYFSRTYAPSRIVGGNFQQDIETLIRAKGITFTYSKRDLHMNLSLSSNDTESVIEGIDYKNKVDRVQANLSYLGKREKFDVSYTESITKTTSPFYNYFDRNRNFRISFGYKKKTWNFNIRGGYTSSTLGNYELFTESLSFSYFPNKKFTLSINSSFSQYRGAIDTEYYSFSEKITYRPGKHWLFSQNASFFSLEDTTSFNLGLGVSYSRGLTKTLKISLGSSGSFSKWMGDRERNYYSYAFNGSLNKNFPSIRSSMNISASYSSLFLDSKKASTSFSVSETFFTNISRSLSFNHSITYMKTTSQEYNYIYEVVRSNNSLSWGGRVLKKFNLNLRVGIDYWKVMTTNIESIKPYIKVSGNYIPTRNLYISFGADIYQDTLYNMDYSVSGNIKVNYSFRKVSVVWTSSFNKEVVKDGFSYDRSFYSTSLRIIRYF